MTPAGSPKAWGDLECWAELSGLFQLDIRTGKPTAWPKDEFLVGWGWREARVTPHEMRCSVFRPKRSSKSFISDDLFIAFKAGFALRSQGRTPGGGLFTGNAVIPG